MRQVLLRLRLDTLFATESIDGISVVGIGWMVIPWTLITAWWLWMAQRQKETATERRALVINYGLGLAVLGAVCLFAQGGKPGPVIPVFGYGFLVFTGCVLAGQTAGRRARREGIPEQLIWDLAIWLFISGLVGARLWYVVQYHERVFAGRMTLSEKFFACVNISAGGLVLYGGVGLSLIAITTFAHRHRDQCRPLRLVDLVIPSFFLALAFGRLGCLMNGCCWGDACSLPWAITFPQGSVPFRTLVGRGFLAPDASTTFRMHPSQIYSTLNSIVLALVTATAFRYSRRHGETLAIALVTYPITRLLLEVLRGDELGQFGTSLTISQCFSLLLLTLGLGFTAWLVRQPVPEPSADFSGVERAPR